MPPTDLVEIYTLNFRMRMFTHFKNNMPEKSILGQILRLFGVNKSGCLLNLTGIFVHKYFDLI